jgi:hypothetical protein
MSPLIIWQKLILNTALALSVLLIGAHAYADEGGLEGFVGNWDVHMKMLHPEKSESTYTETYEWVLDGKFLRGQTGQKSDGTQDIIFATYNKQEQGYPFWVFSSAGTYMYLAPATWNSQSRIMEWRNPPQLDISYQSSCNFPDKNSRYCTLIMKDWKGTVLKELTWSALRHTD